jgi:peptide/nickel transport system substrate-binding protein
VQSETPKTPVTELVAEYWREVGVEIQFKQVTNDLLDKRMKSNMEPLSLWHGDTATDVLFIGQGHPKFFAPGFNDDSCLGIYYGLWFETQGESPDAIEPPDEIKQLYEWFGDYLRTRDVQYAHNVLQYQAENILTIGTVGNSPHPLIVNKNIRNVPPGEDIYWVWDALWLYPTQSAQWYFQEG